MLASNIKSITTKSWLHQPSQVHRPNLTSIPEEDEAEDEALDTSDLPQHRLKKPVMHKRSGSPILTLPKKSRK